MVIRSRTRGLGPRSLGLAALAAVFLIGLFSGAASAAPPVNSVSPAISPSTPEVGKAATASTGTWTSEAPARWLAGTEPLKEGEKVTVTPHSTWFHYAGTYAGSFGELDCETTVSAASLENPAGGGSGVGNVEIAYPMCLGAYAFANCTVTPGGPVGARIELTTVDGKVKLAQVGTNLGTFTLTGKECVVAGSTLKVVGVIEGRFSNAHPRIEFNPETSNTGALRFGSKAGPKVSATGALDFETAEGKDIKTSSLAYAYAWSRCTGATCTAISGATSSSYTPVEADWGQKLKVSVTATDANGSTAAESAQTNAVIGSPHWYVCGEWGGTGVYEDASCSKKGATNPYSWLQPASSSVTASSEALVNIGWTSGGIWYEINCTEVSGAGTLANSGGSSSVKGLDLNFGNCWFSKPGGMECNIKSGGKSHYLDFRPMSATVKTNTTRPELSFVPETGTIFSEFELTGCALLGTYTFTGQFPATFDNADSSVLTTQSEVKASEGMKFQKGPIAGIESRIELREGSKPVKLGFGS